ncbi:MAG: VCBS repeat-containing protein, partial [Thermoanaerobaculaceae bacterium]|nr:VCBS repeat-containing protein [Thermoanaerobaculaceae bacterium]
MGNLQKAVRRLAALLLILFFVLILSAQESKSVNPHYEIRKTDDGFFEVIDKETQSVFYITDKDLRKENESPPNPNTYPRMLFMYFPYGGISSATVADFFGNGEKQVAVCTANTFGDPEGSYLHLYDAQGNEMPGFPLPSADFEVSAFDYGQDGTNDICHYSYDLQSCDPYCPYGIRVVDPYGNTMPNWPKWGPLTSTIDDVNNDGIYEVFSAIAIERPQNLIRIYGFDEWGNTLPGWPVEFHYEPKVPNSMILKIAIGDLDNDGQKEIVTGYGPGSEDIRTIIYAIKPDGSNAPGFPVTFNFGVFYGARIADIDKDGWNEIIFSTGSQMTVLTHDGQIKPGWPRRGSFTNYEPICGGNRTCGGTVYSPTLADLNGDGILEIISGTNNGSAGTGGKALIHIFNPDGTYYPGWPKLMDTIAMSPGGRESVGDVNGDCVPDIVCAIGNSPSNQSGLFAYDVAGLLLPNFPIYVLTDPAHTKGVLTDLNGDGYLDIGISCENILSPWTTLEFFNLAPNPYNRSCIEWPMNNFDIRNTGRYRKLYQIDKNSQFFVDRTAVPADGESLIKLTAIAQTEGPLPPNHTPNLKDQDVRFARNPKNGEFTGPVYDLGEGVYSKFIKAPLSDDPLTTNLMCWINEFKLNTIIPVTFWGRPMVSNYSPNIIAAGNKYSIVVRGRNFPYNITAISSDSALKITNVKYKGTDEVEIDVFADESAEGYYSIRLYGFERYSDPMTFIVYNPKDLLLL